MWYPGRFRSDLVAKDAKNRAGRGLGAIPGASVDLPPTLNGPGGSWVPCRFIRLCFDLVAERIIRKDSFGQAQDFVMFFRKSVVLTVAK